MQFIFIGDPHRDSDEFLELARTVDVRSGDRLIDLGNFSAPSQPVEVETAWSLLRDTFESRDFDDSLVFAE